MSLVQNLTEGDIDIQAFSLFLNSDAATEVPRRLNLPVHSLSHYEQYLEALKSVYTQTDGMVTVDGIAVKPVTVAVRDAIDAAILGDYKTQLEQQIASVAGGKKSYKTYALMVADKANISANSTVDVTNDTTATNNGAYNYDGTTFTKSVYDPLMQSKTYTDTAKSEAISASATDATTKVNAAKTDAITASKTYTDDKDRNSAKLKPAKNLFDKAKAIANYSLTAAGVPIESVGNYLSEFITVKPNTAYSFTLTGSVTFYDVDKLYVSRLVGANENVISPATAKYLRVVVFSSSLAIAQVEEGVVRTIYAPFVEYIQANSVINSSVKDAEITGTKLRDMTVNATKLDDVVWLNMHDATKLEKNKTFLIPSGVEATSDAFDITEYIPCKPSTIYTANYMSRVVFYNRDKSIISVGAELTFTTPENCAYMRFNVSNLVSNRMQVNAGTSIPLGAPLQHKYTLANMNTPIPTYAELATSRRRLYSFTDAWIAWKNKEKFPIAFMGDSTTEGTGTSGGTIRPTGQGLGYDYIRPNSYTAKFQALIREATGNTTMRAYNAGFLGTTANYGLDNFDEIFGSAYSDVKMIGLSFGINDRKADANLYKALFLPKMEALIKKCFDRGVQPFLLTTQPVTIPYWTLSGGGTDIEEVANNCKRDLANKYNLEIIDVNTYGELFMQYSSKPLLNGIMENNSNVIHFGDVGHQFTAELIFSHFCKRVIWTYNDGERLDYSTQKMDSRLLYDNLIQFATPNNGFKLGVNKTQETATDTLLQDFYVFNAGRKQLNLTAFFASVVAGQYVVVDGVQTTITSQGQALGALDLGLHKIKAYSSATTALDWLGFKLAPTA